MKSAAPALAWLEAANACVIGQLGQSLDGRIAMPNGESRGINRAAALDHLHVLRSRVDAVLVGVGTVIADNPALNVRRQQGRNPARIVVDPTNRMPASALCMQSDGGTRCFIITGKPRASADTPANVETIVLAAENNVIAPHRIVEALSQRGFKKILVEGGATTLAKFMDADCLDRLHILLSPLILGAGQIGLNPQPSANIAESRRPMTHYYPLSDGDLLLDCDLRRTRP
ncbi:MAG: RibD family protein [Hyphomicrobiales bacterium]|nr:RibD family protein [Hyphomicrobiales bacterium]MDE2115218.1 RibD family protein [Hyphomicrobiales bacterium]